VPKQELDEIWFRGNKLILLGMEGVVSGEVQQFARDVEKLIAEMKRLQAEYSNLVAGIIQVVENRGQDG
jgi:hypothetical protein